MEENISKFIDFANKNADAFGDFSTYENTEESFNAFTRKYRSATDALAEHFGFSRCSKNNIRL
jgi:hypothetical protein